MRLLRRYTDCLRPFYSITAASRWQNAGIVRLETTKQYALQVQKFIRAFNPLDHDAAQQQRHETCHSLPEPCPMSSQGAADWSGSSALAPLEYLQVLARSTSKVPQKLMVRPSCLALSLLAVAGLIKLGQEVEQVDLVLGKAIDALLQLVNSHGLTAMQLVEEQLVFGAEVQLLASVAAHAGVQLLWQRVLAGLQLPQQIWGDCDVIASAGQSQAASVARPLSNLSRERKTEGV